ncbi:ImcF-related family protein [Pseudomonas moorei]|uniref:Type VI secretion system protein ImpL n=1 Tax=Pseudomonas moorei TaxID=395599 RepID=A0A1H1E2M6_9PSED|nr:ImcF-related family protein [Pseudomonas moorei]KAB0507957.1 type VI secretion protein VasK [Pseudomonas moorei]SDQ82947.1 type VI secretion system protein ImpL [Pseudomonas moorei]
MAVSKQASKGSLVKVGSGYLLVVTLLVVVGCLLYDLSHEYFGWPRLPFKSLVLWGAGTWVALCGFCPVILLAWDRLAVTWATRVTGVEVDAPISPLSKEPGPADDSWVAELKEYLHENHRFLWRRKVRLLLVVGEPDQITAIAPNLNAKKWLAGHDTILLWGGSTQTRFDAGRFTPWQGLSRWRALDAVIWALDSQQSTDARAMDAGVRHLRDLARQLRWQLPLHLWQVCDSRWEQDKRPTQAVGCLLPSGVTPLAVERQLENLLQPLRDSGWAQIQGTMSHDFLLRLSRDLQVEGISRWQQALTPLFRVFDRGVPLRGLWFSLPVPGGKATEENTDHLWHATPPWEGVLADKTLPHRRLGWGVTRVGYSLALGLVLIWGAGLLLSFASNRVHIAQVQTLLVSLKQSQSADEQWLAFNELTRELGRLDYRSEHGSPWYQRFGLNKNPELLQMLWPTYVEANQRLLRDPAVASLQQQLTALIKLPADSPERTRRAGAAYDQLKAYLMLAQPEKVDAAFLVKVLGPLEPSDAGVSPGLWHGLSPTLWQFYGEHLVAHPHWRIEADPKLVAQVRQVLLGQLGQRNAEASLYQTVLDDAANLYPALSLQQMVGETNARALFSTRKQVPGVFTRSAWEGQIRQAIDGIVEARREEIDWVLSDDPTDIAGESTPDQLRQQLTERYLRDYANAWLGFLNSLRWQPVNSLGEVIDQLALMSDVRQSPLIALMNTLAYQGQAGVRGPAFADSLVKSAQKLIGQDKVPAIDQQLPGSGSPLDATFGPLLALLGKDAESRNDSDRLSLQAFLNRVTRVRLKLQQVSNAANPQDMTQALAQSVFQGQNVDLTDTQSYGSLVAASLGAEWDGIGQTLFVQPLEQAWQRVLQPSAAGLNSQWQRAIVDDWHRAFAGRFPFAATASDASLPMLGQMIRADSGRIEQFLQQQLGGVLRKEGQRWVADTRHSQGLRFNPQFLSAINQLSHLADVLFTDGGMGLSFELRAKPVRDLVQTTFILNGDKHHYFNQKERWQRFSWPGFTSHPGTSLTWTSVSAGERLFGDYQGTWGLIRLLEQARITPLNDSDSHYQVQLRAPDGIDLTWHLRTELGAGPMALLKLRNFELPTQVFVVEGTKARRK